MADAAFQNAMRRFNEIGEQIGDLGRKIEFLKREQERIGKFIEAWHEFADASGANANDAIGSLSQTLEIMQKEVSKRATGNPKKELVAEAAREIIGERMEPVSRSDLFKALTDRGIILHGADPEMVLSTMLWRMKDRVVRLKSGGYWLPERDWLPGYYIAGDTGDMMGVRDNNPPEQLTEDDEGEG